MSMKGVRIVKPNETLQPGELESQLHSPRLKLYRLIKCTILEEVRFAYTHMYNFNSVLGRRVFTFPFLLLSGSPLNQYFLVYLLYLLFVFSKEL